MHTGLIEYKFYFIKYVLYTYTHMRIYIAAVIAPLSQRLRQVDIL